tara:strand:- start:8586 stop:9359 length:774 start_codon:yes stop_codon:yes gene_type:complete
MLKELQNLVWIEKKITAEILEKLQEVYDNKDFAGYTNLFEYMVKGLGYSEATASLRQSCLKLIREMPELKVKVSEGKLSYTTLARSYKFIKDQSTEAKRATLSTLENQSSRKALEILEKQSLAPEIKVHKRCYQDKVRITIDLSHEEYERLQRLKALSSHAHENYEKLIKALIHTAHKKYENTHFKQHKSKNPRYIPQRLRNHLLKQAKYRCQYPGCMQDHYLQIDHIQPLAKDGRSTPDNLQVLCHHHNQQKACSH